MKIEGGNGGGEGIYYGVGRGVWRRDIWEGRVRERGLGEGGLRGGDLA